MKSLLLTICRAAVSIRNRRAESWERRGRLDSFREAAPQRRRRPICEERDAFRWQRGRVLERLGRVAEAIVAHRRAIESNARHPAPWLELAGIARARGNAARAADMLARARARGLKHPLLKLEA